MMVCRVCWWLVGVVAATSAAASTESNSPDAAYVRGVRAYFVGDCAAAEPLLVEAIGQAPRDPRPRYFHGLCLCQLGRGDEAKSDFKVAAALEARSRGRYPVEESLEPVRGGDRWLLEQYRWRVRNEDVASGAIEAEDAESQATWTIHTDAAVLRQRISLPIDKLTDQVSLADLAAAGAVADTSGVSAAVSDPFADDGRSTSTTESQGKMASGKLLGILGRAIARSAPMPSLDSLRNQVPGLARQPATDQPFGAAADEQDAASFGAGDDPFAEPTTDDATTDNAATDGGSSPADAADEDDDPFGGF